MFGQFRKNAVLQSDGITRMTKMPKKFGSSQPRKLRLDVTIRNDGFEYGANLQLIVIGGCFGTDHCHIEQISLAVWAPA